jgi:pyruvate/2-oxoglutarate dehydrogenase complex dihydrolipoamide dehydrogenase (E3) component
VLAEKAGARPRRHCGWRALVSARRRAAASSKRHARLLRLRLGGACLMYSCIASGVFSSVFSRVG